MATFSIETFQKALRQPCTLHRTEGEPVASVLIEVTSLHESDDRSSKQFSVVWRGPAAPILRQNIYTVEMPDGERHNLFLVPVGKDKEGILYEAVFT
ncbi:MAG: DUF6916 family protein [Methylococcales bacterium]